MNPQMKSIVDVVLDRSPEELIGGVLAALVLALALAGLFFLLRQKVSDTSTLIISLALGSNLVAMTVAGAYIRHGLTEQFHSGSGSTTMQPGDAFPPPGGGGSRGMLMASRILEAADSDSDGFLTADEAASAAAQFVEAADGGDSSRLDENGLREAIRARMTAMVPGMASYGMGPPPPGDSAAAPGERRGRRHRGDRDRDRSEPGAGEER